MIRRSKYLYGIPFSGVVPRSRRYVALLEFVHVPQRLHPTMRVVIDAPIQIDCLAVADGLTNQGQVALAALATGQLTTSDAAQVMQSISQQTRFFRNNRNK